MRYLLFFDLLIFMSMNFVEVQIRTVQPLRNMCSDVLLFFYHPLAAAGASVAAAPLAAQSAPAPWSQLASG